MGRSVRRIIRKAIPKEILPTPQVVQAAPPPPPPPAPKPAPVATPKVISPPKPAAQAPAPAAAPVAMAAPEPSPAVSDPVPVISEPTESEMTAQKIQKKKKGMKKNILTSVAGLGGETPTYTTMLS